MGKYAILIVSALIFSMIAYSHGLRNAMLSSQMQAAQGYSLTQAQNIAQSTAMIVVNRIREDNAAYIPPADQTYSFPATGNFASWGKMEGAYRVQVENNGDSLLIVRSEGRLEQIDYLVTVKLDNSDPIWDPNLTNAVFAGTSIYMGGSSEILGNVGTNAITAGAVEFKGNPRITGSLTVGPGGDPDVVLNAPDWKGTNSWVEGGVSSASQPFTYNLPPFPDFPPQTNPGESIVLKGLDRRTMSGSNFKNVYIPEITIKSDNTLTINTGGNDLTLHVGNLNIQQGHLKFTGGGEVTLLIEDNITLNGSSTINISGETEDLLTYYKGSNEVSFGGSTTFNSDLFAETADIHLAGSGGLQGDVITGGSNVSISGAADAVSRVIYAPNAAIELTGSGSVRGSVVANTFSARGASEVIFEGESGQLPEIKLGDGETAILSWH